MRSRTLLSLAVAGLFLAAPSVVFAQSIYAGGGVSIPTGEYGDYADSGWLGVAGVTFPVGDGGFAVGAEGFYGQNNHNDVDGDKTNPYGAMAILMYDFGSGESLGFYVFGGAGLLVHKFSSDTSEGGSDSNFGYQGGAGVGVPLGDAFGIWVEGRFMGASDTNFFGILGGFSIDVGG